MRKMAGETVTGSCLRLNGTCSSSNDNKHIVERPDQIIQNSSNDHRFAPIIDSNIVPVYDNNNINRDTPKNTSDIVLPKKPDVFSEFASPFVFITGIFTKIDS